MVTKTRKQRGSRTHGWGAGKKHRGAGHRGGRGNAGSGKRGQQRESKFLAKGVKAIGLGRKITSKDSPNIVINLNDLAKRVKTWESKGKITKEKGILVVNLTKLGYDKLLGYGDPKDLKGKVKIIVEQISESARNKLGLKDNTKKSEGSSAGAGEVPQMGTALRGEKK